MPLSRPALSLGPGPRGVQNARHWVVEVCNDIGRSDLVECAELGVSELVTNALLHAATPIAVRVRGTREHPRVEVSDDDGASWHDAELERDIDDRWAWVRWTFDWRPSRTGPYTLCCRATDETGETQPLEPEWNLGGYENNAVQRVPVLVR